MSEVADLQADLAATGEPIARIIREGWGHWWAELWIPRPEGVAPFPEIISRIKDAPAPPGYWRHGLELSGSRWRARGKAQKMLRRYKAGLHPTDDAPYFEIV